MHIERKQSIRKAGERVPLFHCIRQAPFASTVTAPSLPESVQDVTFILYNLCLVMRRVPPQPYSLRVSDRKSNNGITTRTCSHPSRRDSERARQFTFATTEKQ